MPEQLRNRRVLVACSAGKLAPLASGIEAMGGEVLPFPVIEVRGIEDTRELDGALASLQKYAWIIFTSVHGVGFFMQRLAELGKAVHSRNMPNICAIGPATANALKEFGCEATLIPKRFVAEGVLEALGDYCGGLKNLAAQRILIPRAQEAREVLPEALAAAGARVDVVPCYRNVKPDIPADVISGLAEKKPDLMVFTSSSAIRNMIEILGDRGKKMLLEATVAVLGPITGETAASFGKHAEIIPKENTVPALLAAISGYYGGS